MGAEGRMRKRKNGGREETGGKEEKTEEMRKTKEKGGRPTTCKGSEKGGRRKEDASKAWKEEEKIERRVQREWKSAKTAEIRRAGQK